MHALRRCTGFTGLLTGHWRDPAQHQHVEHVVFFFLLLFVLFTSESVKLEKRNKETGIRYNSCKIHGDIQKKGCNGVPSVEYLIYIYICCIDTSSATDTAVLLR